MVSPKKKPPGGRLRDGMQKLGWYAFQIVVALLALWGARSIVDNPDDFGLAPGALAMFIAWLATGLLARFIDWLRTPRGVVISDEAESDGAGRPFIRRIGDSSQHSSRRRVGQNRGKLS